MAETRNPKSLVDYDEEDDDDIVTLPVNLPQQPAPTSVEPAKADDTATAQHITELGDADDGGLSQKPAVEPCMVCGKCAYKYKCPVCDRKTCSLVCTNTHKERYSCPGTRGIGRWTDFRTAEGDEGTKEKLLKEDYLFLEDVSRVAGAAKRLIKDFGSTLSRHSTADASTVTPIPAAALGNGAACRDGKDGKSGEPAAKADSTAEPRRSGFKRPRPHHDTSRDRLSPEEQDTTQFLPAKLLTLRQQAEKRGVTLVFMPKGMKRHDENTTAWKGSRRAKKKNKPSAVSAPVPAQATDEEDGKATAADNVDDAAKAQGKITWRVVLEFPCSGYSFTEDSVDEDFSIKDILQKYVGTIHQSSMVLNAEMRQKLKEYRVTEDTVVLLRHPFAVRGKTGFYNLGNAANDSSLRTVLTGKTVLEHPVLTILPSAEYHKEHASEYSEYDALRAAAEEEMKKTAQIKEEVSHAEMAAPLLPRRQLLMATPTPWSSAAKGSQEADYSVDPAALLRALQADGLVTK